MFCDQTGRRLTFWGITIIVCGSDCHLCFRCAENPVAAVLNNSKPHQPPLMQQSQLRVKGEAFSWHEEWHQRRGTQEQSEGTHEAESFRKRTPSFPRENVGRPCDWLKPASISSPTCSQSFSIPTPATASPLLNHCLTHRVKQWDEGWWTLREVYLQVHLVAQTTAISMITALSAWPGAPKLLPGALLPPARWPVSRYPQGSCFPTSATAAASVPHRERSRVGVWPQHLAQRAYHTNGQEHSTPH